MTLLRGLNCDNGIVICSAELRNERQARQEEKARTAAQITKLSENNAAIARLNNRLSQQLERSKMESDTLKHLAAGQSAVARAKEAENEAEISGLKHLLKESLAERERIHAQLLAKQVDLPHPSLILHPFLNFSQPP